MKTLTILLIVLGVNFHALSQQGNQEKINKPSFEEDKLEGLNSSLNDQYTWNNSVMIIRCDENGNKVNSDYDANNYVSLVGQQFRILKSNSKYAIIKFLDYTSISKAFTEKNRRITATTSFPVYNFDTIPQKYSSYSNQAKKTRQYGISQKFFRVELKYIQEHATKYNKISPSIAFGLLNLPFKARIQKNKFDFSGNLNINNAIGITYGHQSWRRMKYSTVLSYGISNTLLDSVSVSRNHNRLTSSNTFPTLTLAIGQVFTFDNVQMGIFLGIDRLSRQNQDTYGWTYNGDPWLSIGFGYSIFSVEKENKNIKTKDYNQRKGR